MTDAEVLDSTLLLEYLPSEFWEGSDRLYKSFVTGWWQTLAAARNVLRRGEVPVPAAIIKELSSGLEFQSRMTDCFLNTGGRIDCALDAILKRSEDSHEILGDGSFAEAYDKELKALPFIPLIDDDYELVRTMLAREAGLKSLPCTKALLRYSI